MFPKAFWWGHSLSAFKFVPKARLVLPVIFCFLIASNQSFCQRLRGVIMDSNSQIALPYSTITVLNRNIRVVSDRDGKFELDVFSLNEGDSIMISYIGYISRSYPLNKLNSNTEHNFVLKPAMYEIEPVTISMAKRETTMIGFPKARRMMTGWGDFGSNRGRTRGVLLTGIECPSKVKSFFFRINHNEWDSVSFRLDFRTFKNGQLGSSILREDIIFNASKKHSWVEVNLEKYDLEVCGDILLTLEWVDAVGATGQYSNLLTLSLSNEKGMAYTMEASEKTGKLTLEKNVPAMYIEVYKK